MTKQRLDMLLVTRGLAENKVKAQAVIMAGDVSVNGNVMTKAGSLVAEDAQVQMAAKLPYVSRGGLKLEHALEEFKIGVKGLTCLDVGASTGGFTDCLLQRGTKKVDLDVMDISFISVTSVIPNIFPHLKTPGDMVILFKPQFEADRADVGRGGVIKDPAVHAGTIANLIVWMNQNSLRLLNLSASPILGAEGNREFLIYMRPLKYEIQ